MRKIISITTSPLTLLSAIWLKFVKKHLRHHTITDGIFMKIGILPVPDHYYHPMINPKKHLSRSLRTDRPLPGINFNVTEQLHLLTQFNFNHELVRIPLSKTGNAFPSYYYNNQSFASGDGEYLYNMVRYFKPERIIEIGSGNSTLMSLNAIKANQQEDATYQCELTCIEPYEMEWLEKTGVTIIREKVENIDMALFRTLGKNDILFIDSSHIIRPQGDVLFEYLEILPVLSSGVFVHIHDIFMPKDYLDHWVNTHLMWNEQYLLEAFLSFNNRFRITGALNFLYHHYRQELSATCPILATQEKREPGSFWVVVN